jgi:hypothetical protein
MNDLIIKDKVQLRTAFGERSFGLAYFDTGFTEFAQTSPCMDGIRIKCSNHDSSDASFDNGFHTGTCPAACGTRFQGDVKNGIGARWSAKVLESYDFSMPITYPSMVSFRYDFVIFDDYCTYHRVRMCFTPSFLGKFKSAS